MQSRHTDSDHADCRVYSVGILYYVAVTLHTPLVHSTAHNSSGDLPSYFPDNYHRTDVR